MLSDEDKRSLSKVRYEHAEQCLKTARMLLTENDYLGAANRSYYAVFHAMRSVLALDGIDSPSVYQNGRVSGGIFRNH